MSDRTTHYVEYETKVVNVSAVNLVGRLSVRIVDDESFPEWCLMNDGRCCRLEEWLDKFDGHSVRILIEALDAHDESHLLNE
jgi:hypothetical protein